MRQTQPDNVSHSNLQRGVIGQEAVLIIDRSDGRLQGPHGLTQPRTNQLRLRQAFVDGEITLATVKDRQPGLRQ